MHGGSGSLCGVGIKKAILASEKGDLGAFAAWAVTGGAVLMLVGVAAIGVVSLAVGRSALAPRLIAAGALLALAALHTGLAPSVFVVLVAVVLAGLAGSETARRLRATTPG